MIKFIRLLLIKTLIAAEIRTLVALFEEQDKLNKAANFAADKEDTVASFDIGHGAGIALGIIYALALLAGQKESIDLAAESIKKNHRNLEQAVERAVDKTLKKIAAERC